MAAPPEKRQRTGTEAAEEQPAEEAQADAAMEPAKEAEPEKAEPAKELEEDAAPDKSPKIKDTVNFPVANTTLNVMQSMHGNLLMTLCDGGVQHLLAGSKANVGVKSGRYMFEVKIVEYMNPVEDHSSRSAPRPRNILRVGFSTESASLLMGESSEGFVCFESEGAFIVPKKRTPVGGRFGRDEVISVLLNLDGKSPNHNTVSLFKDGVRITPPQPLPEALHGETLFPTVSFKQMTVHVNFGPEPIVPLPFKCRMLSDVNVKDAKVLPAPKDKDGKKEVVFPVGLPDEGVFDWLDMFHKNNPGYCELSDRMILDWAEKSGIWRQKKAKTSNDKPEMGLGIKEFDEGNVRKVLHSVAPLQARNFVLMELKGNLTKNDRKDTAKSFPANAFKKSAVVLVGEPTAEFKKRTTEILLQQKQDKADAEWKAQKAEEQRQKMMQKKAKELEKAKKRAEKERKKAEKEMRKKLDAEKKAREAAEKGEQGEGEEKKEEDVEMEKEEEEEEEVEEPEEPEEEEKQEEEPPKVELTAEEKKVLFVKHATPDLTPYVLSTSLANFTLPEKDDGFDEIKYEWTKQIKAQDYVKTWIADKKLTTRVEDLTPSDWFQSKWAEWQKALQLWHAKHGEYKAMITKKEAAKAAKKAAAEAKAKEAAAKEAAKEAARKAKEEARAAAEAEGKEVPDDAMEGEEKEPEEEEKKEEEKPEEEEEDVPVDFENLDVFGVNDIMDVGGKMPLFKDFQFEDWTMMGLRFELHLLAHAFRHDVEDAERSGIHVEHLSFYYNKYYKKALSYKYYGVESFKEVVDMVNDAVYLTKKQVLESQLDAEMECMQIFPKLAEEARRYRLLKLALGDESARLKLTQPMQFPAQNRMPAPGGAKGRGMGQKGWYGDGKGGQKGGKPYGPMYQSYSNGGDRSGPWGWGQSYSRQSWNDGKGKGK